MKKKQNLTDGPIKAHLIRLTIPMTWGILSIISFQLVDTFYISMLGTKHLAAISFTFPFTYLIFSFIMGFSIAMASVASRMIGEGKMDSIKQIASHGLLIALIASAFIALIGTLSHDYIFLKMGADQEMLAMIKSYMHIWLIGNIFIAVPLVGNAAIRATGDAFLPAVIMGTVALINVILDPIFIFGLFGFPRMELEGAAIATLIANFAAMLAGLYVIGIHKKLLCSLKNIRFDLFGNSLKQLLSIALPVGITNTIQPFVTAIILMLLARYGTEAVAAFGVVSRIEAFAFVILMALSTGMAPIIGQNWGAAKFNRVHETLKLAIGFNVLWSLFIAGLLIIFAHPIANAFSSDETVIYYMVLFFQIVPLSYAFGNLVMGWASAFNAMGMPMRSLTMILIKTLVLLLPAVYIGNAYYGVSGIFIAMASVNVLTGIAFHVLNTRKCHAKEHEINAVKS